MKLWQRPETKAWLINWRAFQWHQSLSAYMPIKFWSYTSLSCLMPIRCIIYQKENELKYHHQKIQNWFWGWTSQFRYISSIWYFSEESVTCFDWKIDERLNSSETYYTNLMKLNPAPLTHFWRALLLIGLAFTHVLFRLRLCAEILLVFQIRRSLTN